MAESTRVEAEYKEKVAYLEKEFAISMVAQTAAQAELETTPRQMTSVAIDATLHAWAELMEEFKAGKHAEWDPNYEISLWMEKEAELAEAGGEGNTVGEPSTPRVEIPRNFELAQVEVGSNVATQEEGTTKNPNGELEVTVQK